MFRIQWLPNLLETGSSGKDRRRLAARKRKPVSLILESLEERLTPSAPTQTAGSYADLVNAVAADTAAKTNYVIQITGSFQFNSGQQVTISKLSSGSTLTLSGQNGTNFTLTGNGNRLFTVGSGQTVTFKDLTLTGGKVTTTGYNAADGGAILDSGGNVTLSKMVVEGNAVKGPFGAAGGGVYVSGAGTFSTRNNTVVIRDSILRDNTVQGSRGADGTTHGTANGRDAQSGGSAYGGGLYVGGSGWTVTLIGDTLSGNTVIGGDGGDGAAGPNATGSNAQAGRGGNGGDGGDAMGGAAYFSFINSVHDPLPNGTIPPYPNGQLTILNDPDAPTTYPSLMFANSVQAGNGGKGAAGGTSTGTADNANGGWGGRAGIASGGAVHITSNPVGGTFTANIGNTTFLGNRVSGGNGGAGGPAGTGGSGAAGALGINQTSGFTTGGGVGIDLSGGGALAMVNSTVAKNILIAGFNADGTHGHAEGGGLYDSNGGTFDNNTITQNTLNGASNKGSGVAIEYGNPSLFNNLIQGNRSLGSSAPELYSQNTLTNASHNFLASINPNAVSKQANIVGSNQPQLGSVVGVDANGHPTGGPVYYPLLPGVVSIGAGTTSVLNTIAGVEGTTVADATDEIGNPLSRNRSIDLGAVQVVTAPPLSPPSPSPTPPTLNVPPLLAFLDSLLSGIEAVNANGTETITDSFFGIPLIVSTFDSHGDLMSVDLYGFFNITFLFE